MNQIGPSIIRTVVPLIVAAVVSQLVQRGIDPGPYQELIAQVVGAVVAAGYYGAVRLLETYVRPRLGLLLGSAKTPTYEAPAKPAPESPTGYVATEDAPAPEGAPVTVEPVEPAPFVDGVTVQDLVDHALSQPMADTKADAAYHGKHAE